MRKKILILHQNTPLSQAARAMVERNVGCVLVCDTKGYLIGIATDRDLACSIAMEQNGPETPLSDVMTPRPVTVEETATAEEIVRLMVETGVRRIPVVKRMTVGGSRCVGIVTLDDLLANNLIDPQSLARVIRMQMRSNWGRHEFHHTESRAEARAENTLKRFYKIITQSVNISADIVEPITLFLLECLVRRLHYTSSAHFIAQLPKDLQETLLDQPAGPDRQITPDLMMHRLFNHFKVRHPRQVLESFFSTLYKLVDPKEVDHLQAQLPEEFRTLFQKSRPPSQRGEVA